jgi:AcrR family transcriptional regulator
MFIQMMKRRYVLKQRAESRDETRQRIVEATAALHEELGPRQATISAIAERAGVQRLTVYRHFPDEVSLFQACTSHWLDGHPPPDPRDWQGATGLERVRTALTRLYAYYRATERMWTVSYRDEQEVAGLQGPLKAFRNYMDGIGGDLVAGLGKVKDPAATAATLAHAVRFSTWQTLSGAGLTDRAMADLVCSWLSGSA